MTNPNPAQQPYGQPQRQFATWPMPGQEPPKNAKLSKLSTFRALAVLLVAASMSILPYVRADAAPTFPALVGHRGVGDTSTAELGIPENSIPAIQWAAKNHADIVEGDVRVTRDGKMVMMHDETIDRTTNRRGKVRDRDLSYIKKAKLEVPRDNDGNGNPDNTKYSPPSANAWLKAAKATDKLVFMELKGSGWSPSQMKKYAKWVNGLGMKSKVITASGEKRLSYFERYSSGHRSWAVRKIPPTSKVKDVAGSSGYATISLAKAERNPAYVKQLEAMGIKVLVYTLADSTDYKRALPLGAHGWMVNNSKDAHEWLEANGA